MPEHDELVVGGQRPWLTRVKARLQSARERERRRGSHPVGRLGTFVVIVIASLLATIGAITGRGSDLRNERNRSLAEMVRTQAGTNRQLQARLAELRAQTEQLSRSQPVDPKLTAAVDAAEVASGTVPVRGPAIRVTLSDAPADVNPEGVAEDLLVVHQQDIQLVVNVLWAAGAEAMTIQGQRVVSTTAVKCVGNSIVLHGVPYAPPYRIEAIGDPAQLLAALDADPGVAVYQQYVKAYQLGWKQENIGEVTMPAAVSGVALTHASQPPR